MKVFYDDVDYARARLNGTMVSYKGEPAFVDNVRDLDNVVISVWPRNGDFISVSVDDLDLTPPQLGFMNLQESCHYVTRMPMRQWKQGFRPNQAETYGPPARLPHSSHHFFINLYKGIYPSYEECMETVCCEEAKSKAFSRHFGIVKKGKKTLLVFKKYFVAELDPKPSNNVQPIWAPGKDFLTEFFNQTLETSNGKQ